jgi:hypothetical protein
VERGSLWMDVVDSRSLASFSQFGLQACYQFHGYRIIESRRIDVGAPAVGQSFTYFNGSTKSYWTILSWVWPVTSVSKNRFERVVLMANYADPAVPNDATASRAQLSLRVQDARSELLMFAHEVITDHASSKVGAPTRSASA